MNNLLLPKKFKLSDIKDFFEHTRQIKLNSDVINDIEDSRDFIEKIILNNAPVYGVNTGFGKLASKQINKKDLDILQLNLIRSHTAGSGEELPKEIIKLAMVLLVNSLTKGNSGVRLELIKKLISLTNSEYVPIVLKYGSLGASGDLIPLSHTISALIGEYPVRNAINEKIESLSEIAPELVMKNGLKAKEGLALINGTHYTTSTTIISLLNIINNVLHSFIAFSLSVDAMLASLKPFQEELHIVRPHPGQIWTAKLVRSLLKESELARYHEDPAIDPRVQDPYSYRCFPQVMGGVLQALIHAKEVLEIEMSSVTDNPLIFTKIDEIISGGNFHAEPIAMVADYLAIAVTNLMGIMEKQIEKLLNPSHNYNLPAFLTSNPGLNSGYMIAHFGQAALINRAILLSKPSSVDNVSTSANQEDFVSMGMNSALKLYEINELFSDFLSYYFLQVSQALTLRKEQIKKDSSIANEKLIKEIRKFIPKLEDDRQLEPDLKIMKRLIKDKNLLKVLDLSELKEFENWLLN